MKVSKNYHSALTDEIQNLKELDYYKYNNSHVIAHNLIDGVLPLFYEADVIYSEPAWRSGYKTFIDRTDCKNDDFNLYLFSIQRIINELKKPTFIITGKHAINKLNPDYITEIQLHGYSSLLAIWNHDKVEFKDNWEAIDKLSEKFNTVLDFNCGYGNVASKFKNFICSDLNKKCVYYIAKKYMGYDS